MDAKITESQKQEIIKKYVNGESAIRLAGEYGISRQRVHLLVNKAGVKRTVVRTLEPK